MPDESALIPVRESATLAQKMLSSERVRAAIPLEDIVGRAHVALETGRWSGHARDDELLEAVAKVIAEHDIEDGEARQIAMALFSADLLVKFDPVEGKQRIDLMKMLLGKGMPDLKAVDVDQRSDAADRQRRRLQDITKDQLAGLSESELEDLIRSEEQK